MDKNKLNNSGLGNNTFDSVEQLTKIRKAVDNYTKKITFTPPLSQNEILYHSGQIILSNQEFAGFEKLIAILVNNKVWEPVLAEIPFERRILLLPKCFRNSTKCEAEFDEFGLLCETCGNCLIGDVITSAESKGYNVIVSEGTTTVSVLLTSQQVDCVIGVGCIDSLEKSFPLVFKNAIPSYALPLFNSDCRDSKVDEVWVNEVLEIKNENKTTRLINIENLRKEVSDWFELNSLTNIIPTESKTEQLGVEWLSDGGKHWRPLITASLYNALTGEKISENKSLRTLAIAVESFHKASLIHDDIADNDLERYGKPVLHLEHNVPIALNLGDLLTGYGYELIHKANLSPGKTAKLLKVASKGHKDLCIGQGEELLWRQNSNHLSVEEILYIFKMKTAPAFEVALKFGAIAAGVSDEFLIMLKKFSEYLGIAYQIQDDIDDYILEVEKNDFSIIRPSLIYSLLAKKDPEKTSLLLSQIKADDSASVVRFNKFANENKVVDEAKEMLRDYKTKTLLSLDACQNASVKILLYRLVNKIIKD